MKSKVFLIFLVLMIFLVYERNKRFAKGTNLKFISQKEYNSKRKNLPLWAYHQIGQDFSSFSIITLDAIENTYKKIWENKKEGFFRYRIVNGKLYRYYFEGEKKATKKLDFERALLTLLKMEKMPDMDFIYSDLDGLPLDIVPQSIYMTEKFCPILCHAKLEDAINLVLIPDHNFLSKNWKKLYFQVLKERKNINWEEKLGKAFWRGGTNDQSYFSDSFHLKPRIIISKMSQKNPDLLDAGITRSWFIKMEEVLKKENLLKEVSSIEEHLKCKYLPVIDGNMCTYPGYQWRLLSSSVCFKQTSRQIQWFYSALKPYEHFIPIENDCNDLEEKIMWAKKNDKKCKNIIARANEFAQNNLTYEDGYAYLYNVLKKYAKKQAFDKALLEKDIKQSNWMLLTGRK